MRPNISKELIMEQAKKFVKHRNHETVLLSINMKNDRQRLGKNDDEFTIASRSYIYPVWIKE